MTLSTTASRINYPGAGSTGPFTIPFRFTTVSDLLVTKRSSAGVETTLTNVTHYSVTGAGNATGALTLVTALAAGETLSIRRRPSNAQSTDFANQGSYFGSTHEAAHDRVTMLVQALQDQLDRSFGVSESWDPSVLSLRIKPETGKVLAWQSSTLLGNSTLDASSIALPGQSRTVDSVSAYLANNAVFNVLDYGAVGDGVTDDRVAIQEALDECAAAGGGTVLVPKGTFVIGAALDAVNGGYVGLKIQSNTRLMGEGRGVSIIKSMDGLDELPELEDEPPEVVRVLHDETDIIVSNLTVDGNRAGNPAWPVVDSSSYCLAVFGQRVLIENVEAKNNPANGMGCPGINARDVTFRGCYSHTNGKKGFYFGIVGRIHVTGCFAYNNRTAPGSTDLIGIGISGDQGIFDSIFAGNTCYGNGSFGIYVGNSGSDTVDTDSRGRQVVVANNTCIDNDDVGIYVDARDDTDPPDLTCAVKVIVAANQCLRNGGAGISCFTAAFVTLLANICEDNDKQGIYYVDCQWLTIGHNICRNNNRVAHGASAAGIYGFRAAQTQSARTDNQNITLAANIVVDDQAVPTQTTAIDFFCADGTTIVYGNQAYTQTSGYGIRDRDGGNKVFGNNSDDAMDVRAVSGSRGGNAALADFLTEMAGLAFISDGTSA